MCVYFCVGVCVCDDFSVPLSTASRKVFSSFEDSLHVLVLERVRENCRKTLSNRGEFLIFLP